MNLHNTWHTCMLPWVAYHSAPLVMPPGNLWLSPHRPAWPTSLLMLGWLEAYKEARDTNVASSAVGDWVEKMCTTAIIHVDILYCILWSELCHHQKDMLLPWLHPTSLQRGQMDCLDYCKPSQSLQTPLVGICASKHPLPPQCCLC